VRTATVSRAFAGLALLCAAYVAFLLTRYFYPPHVPRFRIESFFMWFVAAGVAAVWLRPSPAGVTSASDDRDHPMDSSLLFGIFGGFVAVVFIEYWSALGVGWLSDDFVLADWAARHQWVHVSATGFVRPIVPFVWALLSILPGQLEVNVHAANLLLHALNALLVVILAARLGARRVEAIAAGVIFLTFPALSEALVWASGMQDVLMTTFALASILAVLDAGFSTGAAVAAAGGTLVAILAKETAIVVPLLAWLVAWASPLGIRSGRRRTALVAMTAVALVYALVRTILGMPSGYGTGVSRYFAKQLIVDPFASLAAPWSAAWIDAHAFSSLVRVLLIVALLAVAFATWRRSVAFNRAALFAVWVLAGVLPVFSLFHVSGTLEGSRYLYLPGVGFSLLLAALARTAADVAGERRLTAVIATATAVLVVPAMIAARSELSRWIEAARLRDNILISYVRVMPSASCGSIVTEGKADTLDGAYVLRNGFMQALADLGAEVEPDGPSMPHCRVSWTDHLVVKQE
jgi:hypothetical protein